MLSGRCTSGWLACTARAAARAATLPRLEGSAAAAAARPFATSVADKELIPSKLVKHPYITGGKRYLPGFSMPAPRKLEDIIKYALLEREPPERIKTIWNEFHDARLDTVATTWSTAEWEGVQERKRRCPRFIYPVFKGAGTFFNLIAEWQDKFCIFTFLEDYRRNPAAAEPYMSVALYDDFLARKQLVLVRGDFSGHLRKADAVHLLNMMRHYYFTEPRAVETFNKDPGAFDFASFIRDAPKPPGLDGDAVSGSTPAAVARPV